MPGVPTACERPRPPTPRRRRVTRILTLTRTGTTRTRTPRRTHTLIRSHTPPHATATDRLQGREVRVEEQGELEEAAGRTVTIEEERRMGETGEEETRR